MLSITGYVDRWSVRPGEPIAFMVSVQGGGGYRARIARVICGDPNPAGAGYRDIPAEWALEGEHAGEQQDIHLGSWVDVPEVVLPEGGVTFAATIWPTRLEAGDQAVLCWAGAAGSLTLGVGPEGAYAVLVSRSGKVVVRTNAPLTERAWHDLECTLAGGQLIVRQIPHKKRLDRHDDAVGSAAAGLIAGAGAVAIAADRCGDGPTCLFNGKVERPRILTGESVVAEWDFSRAMGSDTVEDAGPQGWHGTLVNLPTRAMTGSNWRGTVHRWTEDPAQ